MVTAVSAAALFLGAALLFLVQPLIGKRLLPLVGGTPAAWNTSLVFFQAVLLAAYFYAHRSTQRLGVRRQAALHLGVLLLVPAAFAAALAVAGAPLIVRPELVPAGEDHPAPGLLALLAVAVGVPFFVLAATAPLVQRWYAAAGTGANDPYFLYAASNAGSLAGLLGFPLLIEPWLPLGAVDWAWAGGAVVCAALVGWCGLHAVRCAQEEPHPASAPPGADTPSARRIARWIALAALPSGLLLGVTAHLTTDLAPVPLLWVVPLALYLLSFILVFARWSDAAQRRTARIVPMLLLFVVLALLTGAAEPFALVAGLHLAAFFGASLLCHGELARDRPPAEHLTRFYLWLSFGGVLGGAFAALAAPLLFHRLGAVEYPLALVLAARVRPRGAPVRFRAFDALLVLGVLALAVGLALSATNSTLKFGLPAVAAFALIRNPIRFALALAALFVGGACDPQRYGETLHLERNSFGTLRVTRTPDRRYLELVHGHTLHGRQRADERDAPRPLTYYHPRGPIGRVFATLPRERVNRVGVVGLGIGSVAAYGDAGQHWTFYEIDPAVVRIARDGPWFTFLASCRAEWRIVLGDARRELANADDGAFDVLVLDAFSSDAIPVHLLTREALRLYVAKLAPHGVLALHVSNLHLDLPPLIARLAADAEPPLAVRYAPDVATALERADGKSDSQWMILARDEADLAPILTHRPAGASRPMVWERVPLVPGPLWRDDFANVLALWKRHAVE